MRWASCDTCKWMVEHTGVFILSEEWSYKTGYWPLTKKHVVPAKEDEIPNRFECRYQWPEAFRRWENGYGGPEVRPDFFCKDWEKSP